MTTSRPDNNYFSIFNGVSNLVGQVGVPVPPSLTPDNPTQYAAILKLSGVGTNNQAYSLEAVSQGAEACCDCNNLASGLSIHSAQWGAPGQSGEHIFKIKGGAHDITFSGKVVSTSTKRGDITLGEWSDQSTEPVMRISFSGISTDGGRVLTVLVGHAAWPTPAQLGSCCKVDLIGSIGAKTYWWGKYALIQSGLWSLGVSILGAIKALAGTA